MMKLEPMKALETTAKMKPMKLLEYMVFFPRCEGSEWFGTLDCMKGWTRMEWARKSSFGFWRGNLCCYLVILLFGLVNELEESDRERKCEHVNPHLEFVFLFIFTLTWQYFFLRKKKLGNILLFDWVIRIRIYNVWTKRFILSIHPT